MQRRAISARIVSGTSLEVCRNDHSQVVIDLLPYLDKGVVRALQDAGLLGSVEIDALGGAEWPNRASLPPKLLAAEYPVACPSFAGSA